VGFREWTVNVGELGKSLGRWVQIPVGGHQR